VIYDWRNSSTHKRIGYRLQLVRAGLDRKKAIEDMGGEISSFFASKEAVEAKIVEVKKHNKMLTSALL
jgi:hypothetical protein